MVCVSGVWWRQQSGDNEPHAAAGPRWLHTEVGCRVRVAECCSCAVACSPTERRLARTEHRQIRSDAVRRLHSARADATQLLRDDGAESRLVTRTVERLIAISRSVHTEAEMRQRATRLCGGRVSAAVSSGSAEACNTAAALQPLRSLLRLSSSQHTKLTAGVSIDHLRSESGAAQPVSTATLPSHVLHAANTSAATLTTTTVLTAFVCKCRVLAQCRIWHGAM